MTGRGAGWLKTYWPHVFGSIIAGVVGVPAAVASYRHGIAVVDRSGDEAMASWLPMTTDGLLLAALVALWVRRMTGRTIGPVPWAAFGVGLVMTVATNLAGARQHIPSGPIGVAHVEVVGVALWPPLCLAIVLELVALIVVPDQRTGLTPGVLAELEEGTGLPVMPAGDGEATYLYRFLAEDGALLYGGITWWLQPRFAKHRRVQSWWDEVAWITVTTYANRFDALADEIKMIETERPKYNRAEGDIQDAASGPRPMNHQPAGPLRRTGVIDVADAVVEGNSPADDTDLIEHLRQWAAEEGAMPSRERVRIKYSVGTKRADRVRTAALTTWPGHAPDLVRLVPAQSDSDDREASG